MHKVTNFDQKSNKLLYSKTLFYYTYTKGETTLLFIWNEETNKKKAITHIQNGNTKYVCGSGWKLVAFAQENGLIVNYEFRHAMQIADKMLHSFLTLHSDMQNKIMQIKTVKFLLSFGIQTLVKFTWKMMIYFSINAVL